MAIQWGPVAGPGGSREFRVGVEFDPIPSVSAPSVTVTARIYIWTKVRVTEAQGRLSWSGYTHGSATNQNFSTSSGTAWDTANIRKVRDVVGSADTSPSGGTVTLSAEASGITYVGTGYVARVTASAPVPPRDVNLPPAPTSITWSRVSDTQHEIRVVHASAPASAPIMQTLIHRRTDEGPWQHVATLPGAAPSWTDTGTAPDHRYEWQARSGNTAGYSAPRDHQGYAYTTPAAPSSVAARKAGADIEVSWLRRDRWATQYEVQDTPGGGGSPSVVGAGAGSPYVHTAPDATKTHIYRVRAKTPDGRVSAWSEPSATVQLLTAPAAPSGLSGDPADPTGPIVRTWVHSPRDTTGQTQYQVRYRMQGASAWTTPPVVTSGVSRHTWPAGTWTSGSVEWQVRTRGQHADWSPWSGSALMVLSRRPTMGAIGPTEVRGDQVTATWTYHDPEGGVQSRAVLRLEVGGKVVETRSTTAGSARQLTFQTRVVDGAKVRWRGVVYDTVGLASTEAVSPLVTVAYAPPVAPTVSVVYDEDTGEASLRMDSTPTDQVAGHDPYLWQTSTTQIYRPAGDPNGMPNYESWQVSSPYSGSVATTQWMVTNGPIGANRYRWIEGLDGGTYELALRACRAGNPTPATLRITWQGCEPDGTPIPGGGGQSNFPIQYNRVNDGTPWTQIVDLKGATCLRWWIGIPAGFTPGTHTYMITRPTVTPHGRADTSHYRVLAEDGDGGWRVVADQVPPGGAATDRTPIVGVPTQYRIEAVASNGATITRGLTAVGDLQSRYWLTPAQGHSVWFADNPTFQMESGHDSSLVQYEGRTYPVQHTSGRKLQTARLSAQLFHGDSSTSQEITSLAQSGQPVCLRTPAGHRFWASVQGMSSEASTYHSERISLTLARIASLDEEAR